MKQKLSILLIFLARSLTAQFHGDYKVGSDSIYNWNPETKNEYYGTYLFGFSEGESELRIFGSDSVTIAQLRSYVWNDSNWIETFKTFTNVNIINSKFVSDQANGEFITFILKGKTEKGLWVKNPWSHEFHDGGEIGVSWRTELKGKYSIASAKILSESYLMSFSLAELKIMRNEIFARYAYKFRNGGEMDLYFSKTNWYYSHYTNVDEFLTEIEKINISLIKKVENKKR